MDGDKPVGDWLIEFEQQERVKQRITCDELGYPMCEALFVDVQEWEQHTGLNWLQHIADIA